MSALHVSEAALRYRATKPAHADTPDLKCAQMCACQGLLQHLAEIRTKTPAYEGINNSYVCLFKACTGLFGSIAETQSAQPATAEAPNVRCRHWWAHALASAFWLRYSPRYAPIQPAGKGINMLQTWSQHYSKVAETCP